MNLNSVKKQLQKINALVSVMESEEPISAIERDLLKSYVQQLYAEIVQNAGSSRKEVKNELPVHLEKPAVKAEKTLVKNEVIDQVVETKVPETPDLPAYLTDPIDDEPVNSFQENRPVNVHSANGHAREDAAVMVKEIPQEAGPSGAVMDLPEVDEQVKALFSESKANDLSDKLRNSRITDINAAFGLNDRILMVNELFGGKHDLFRSAVEKLNGMNSFAEAKKFLIKECVSQQNWSADQRFKTATRFIQTVRRRYI